MKSNKKYTSLFVILCLLLFNLMVRAGSYTWSGGVSTVFSDSLNWVPVSSSGGPGQNDSILITSGALNNCVIAANQTVYLLSVNADTIFLNGFQLTVNNITISGGLVSGGNLTVYGSAGSATFSGGTISSVLHVTSPVILFSGTTFESSVTAIKTGNSDSSAGMGGCTFNSTVVLVDSSSGSWTFASATSPDTWNDRVTVTEASSGNIFFAHNATGNSFSKSVSFTNSSTGRIFCNYYGGSVFHDSLVFNSNSTGSIQFGNGGGTTTLDTGILAVGSVGLSSSGKLILKRIDQQDDSKSISLSASGTFEISLSSCIFDGNLAVAAPNVTVENNRFNGITSITHTGYNTNFSIGRNFFGDTTEIVHDNAIDGAFYTGTTYADTFMAPVTVKNLQKGKIGVINADFIDKATLINYSVLPNSIGGIGSATPGYTLLIADGGICIFRDTVTLDNDTAASSFGTSSGNVYLQEDALLNVLPTFKGDLLLSNITQENESELIIPFSLNPGILALDTGNLFAGKVTCSVQRVQLNGSTYTNDFSLTRMNAVYNDTSKGGNIFQRLTELMDSNSTSDMFLA